jgi:hypothetical protein
MGVNDLYGYVILNIIDTRVIILSSYYYMGVNDLYGYVILNIIDTRVIICGIILLHGCQ